MPELFEKSVLYIVPTPIGNLSDITERARGVLESCDFIAAEDTRKTGKLLLLLGIKKPMTSYHEHNKASSGKRIAERIKRGETCALVTDAGTPAVSDPGSDLVALCAREGIKITALPGPCAAVTALSGSGLASRRFCFEGFMPDTPRARADYLETVKDERRTLIFYIAPHDLEESLAALQSALGDRSCVLAKELTKLNERYWRDSLSSVIKTLSESHDSLKKGEFVLLVEGAPEEKGGEWEDISIEEHLLRYIKLGLSKMDACKQAAKDRGIPKSEIYKIASELDGLKHGSGSRRKEENRK